MKELYEAAIKLAEYLGCVGIGALASWYFTKKYYDKLVAEEIESIRSIHNTNKKDKEANEEMSKKKKTNCEDILTTYYTQEEYPKDDSFADPYPITMEEFDDTSSDFIKVSLDYYTEDSCLVENGEAIDPNISVGVDNLARFAKRMDLIVMYIRNERLKIDYEVTKYIDRWNE